MHPSFTHLHIPSYHLPFNLATSPQNKTHTTATTTKCIIETTSHRKYFIMEALVFLVKYMATLSFPPITFR